jgi:hypothetical protein
MSERDDDVDTKSHDDETFGNDADLATRVDTKCRSGSTFGNDSNVGFIRVRKRKLKGGKPHIRALPSFYGVRPRASMSFDLVKAVRVNGKPRHKFVLGLGSQKDGVTGSRAAEFLLSALRSMKRHGLNKSQRGLLLTELIRKGARRPTIAEVEGCHPMLRSYVDELVAWLRTAP